MGVTDNIENSVDTGKVINIAHVDDLVNIVNVEHFLKFDIIFTSDSIYQHG